MNALTHCVRYAPYKGDAFFPPPKTLCTPLHTLDPLTSQLLSSLLSWPSPASRVSAFLRPYIPFPIPTLTRKPMICCNQRLLPTSPLPFFFLWSFLFLCMEQKDKVSSWVKGWSLVLKVESEGFTARSTFHVAFVPLAQLTVPRSPPCILMKGDETG